MCTIDNTSYIFVESASRRDNQNIFSPRLWQLNFFTFVIRCTLKMLAMLTIRNIFFKIKFSTSNLASKNSIFFGKKQADTMCCSSYFKYVWSRGLLSNVPHLVGFLCYYWTIHIENEGKTSDVYRIIWSWNRLFSLRLDSEEKLFRWPELKLFQILVFQTEWDSCKPVEYKFQIVDL